MSDHNFVFFGSAIPQMNMYNKARKTKELRKHGIGLCQNCAYWQKLNEDGECRRSCKSFPKRSPKAWCAQYYPLREDELDNMEIVWKK